MPDARWIWTPLDASDADAIHALILEIEEADDSANRTTRDEVDSYFLNSHVWRAQGAWAGQELLAFGLLRTPVANGGELPLTMSGGVAPSWRAHGLGRDLMERQLITARSLARELGMETASVQMYIDNSQFDLLDMADRLGFERESQYVQMRRSLAIPVGEPQISPYTRILKLTGEWVNDTRRAHNRVLADNLTYTKLGNEAWQARLRMMEEDWCLVAIDFFGDRPRLAGYLLSSRFASNTKEGTTNDAVYDEGYVEEVVVLPQWRGRHIASALLTAAMGRFRDAGLSYIGLDIAGEGSQRSSLITVFEHFDFERVAETYIVTTTV
ncbi:GNAT family N-acetyltransferase [Trueperella pecoris]|uniref:GNAT family N-acetyltransferase n=1 Tax=Trueperella pecoris TaxID=2733571 RepID=UPI00186B6829|nr:GNAT family N-acetyltransferase [Trueperella pecoris]QOQ38916.1 GNAT family N-acetyltransferase [Trueperella pecoris]QTG76282.1 GNAT family N-acetyltransferase [Trueperella pecoris]